MKRSQNRQHGFTLIEAIVALVLIATAGMALFSWINSNIITLNRIQEINAVNTATANALEYMATINPMATQHGYSDLGAYRIEWDAVAITETRDGADYPYSISLFQLDLYQTTVTLKMPSGQVWFSFDMQQVGYKRVRELSFGG